MGEMPLVIFTVLSQMAVGAVTTLWLLDRAGQIEVRAGAFAAKMIAVITGISLLVSLGHLGHPLEAYRALSHLSASWLSREVALFGIFFALTLVYWFQWRNESSRKQAGVLTAAVGLIAVITSAMVYVLPARPAWNHLGPVLFFLLTTATVGPLFLATLLKAKQYIMTKPAYGVVTAALVAGLLSFALYLSMLMAQGDVAAITGGNILMSAVFWPRIIAGWIAPIAILAYAAGKPEWDVRSKVVTLFILVLLGELLGRGLFYDTAVALMITGM